MDASSFNIIISKRREFKFQSMESKSNIKSGRYNKCFKQRLSPMSNHVCKYELPKQEILPIEKLKKDQILLPLKIFIKEQNNYRFKKYLNIRIYNKYKILLARYKKLFETREVHDHVLTITDLDEDFFRNVNGRPTFAHVPIFKTIKYMLNDLLRIRHEIGYKKDCIFNKEMNFRQEKSIFELSTKRLTQQANFFDNFISQDYHNSMVLLKKWEEIEQKVQIQNSELHTVANEIFSIKSRLVGLDYIYSQQQKFGRFLYYLSPPTWRIHHRDFARSVEIEAKGFDFGQSNDDDTFNIIFEKLRNICNSTAVRPVLYFTRPEDIIQVFNTMEYQQLHYFTHVTHLKPYIKKLRETIKTLKEINAQDNVSVLNSIKNFENLLSFYEGRCNDLKSKFYKILFGTFYDCVGKLDVLKLKLHLEFCFETIILDKPLNMDLTSIARSLENVYMDYSNRLDAVKSTRVRRAVEKCQEMENQKLKRAYRAAKELRLFNRLEKQMLGAYDIYLSSGRQMENKKKSTKKLSKLPENKVNGCKISKECKTRSLTVDEIEYLKLFTDWTENEDPAKYLQRLSLRESN